MKNWICFRPTALKCYLYQADPDLYRAGPGRSIFRTVHVPAYRNLYLMTPGVVLLLSVLVGLPIVLLTSWIQGTSIEWLNWAGGVAGSLGALRAQFYVFQIIPALRCALRGWGGHPIKWDELMVLPLPGARRELVRQLRQDEREGLRLVALVARNPFQRWAAQAALVAHTHAHARPIAFLYALMENTDLEEYVTAPLVQWAWRDYIGLRRLFIGELTPHFVNTEEGNRYEFIDRLVWRLTLPLRDR
jgi:hypothetical protein